MKTFRFELTSLLNKHSKENESGTADYILAEYLMASLENFERVLRLKQENEKGFIKHSEPVLIYNGLKPTINTVAPSVDYNEKGVE